MAQIELNPIASGYSTGLINDNFEEIEQQLNNNFLRRDNVDPGQPNEMNNDLDMNNNQILNIATDPTKPDSLVTVGQADLLYVNVSGDSMQGPLSMGSNALTVREAVGATEPVRKARLDAEIQARIAGDAAVSQAYQSADASLQAQISGGAPLEASAFSVISWHDQVVENSVEIPPNKNAWSFGPVVTVETGQTVTVGENSFWTIANGEVQ